MSQRSKIEWTQATWNLVHGCDKISPGCLNCYAETFAERFRGVDGHPCEHGFAPLRWGLQCGHGCDTVENRLGGRSSRRSAALAASMRPRL